MDRRLHARERGFETGAPLALRHLAQVLVAERQQVPRDEARRRLGGQHVHPRRGRVDAQQQRLEVERPVPGDDDLAVEDAPLRERRPERLGELREVAIERLQVARLRVDLVAVAEDDRPEPVPFGLEQPAVAVGQAVDRLGEHRFDRRFDGQVQGHARSVGEGVSRQRRSSAVLRSLPARGSRRTGCLVHGIRERSSRRSSARSIRDASFGRQPWQGRDEGRDGVVRQHGEVVRVECGLAVGRHEARVDDPLEVPLRHERRRARAG